MNNQGHYAAAMSAFVIWGFFSIPLRAVEDFTAGEILYFRILFSLIALLIVILAFKTKDLQQDWKRLIALPREQIRTTVFLTLAGGALLGVNWLTFIYIVNDINVKTASFSYLICPVITAILGYLLLQEKLNIIQWVSVGLCAISCLLIGLSSALELWYSVLTALTYALYLISQRKNQGFDRIIGLGVQVIFCFVMLSFVRGYLVDRVPTSAHFYGVVMIIAVFFTILPLFLNLFALNKINSATIGILMYINPLINFSVALIVFKEHISMLQAMGYSLIIVALILFNYPNMRKIQAAASLKRTH